MKGIHIASDIENILGIKKNERVGVDSVTPPINDRQETKQVIEQNFDFILSHFEEPIFPRTISTRTTEGRQILVLNKKEALARFEQANFFDCRINGFPDYVGFEGVNRQAPNFILIDLDRSIFKTDRQFQLAVKRTTKNINEILGGMPTIIWTGNGVQVYQPVHAFLLESESLFAKFDQPSQAFLRFAEKHLSNNKCDPAHNPGFRSCMLRIPGSHNFKCVQRNGLADLAAEVKLIQRWNGTRPRINPLLCDFHEFIGDSRISSRRRPIKKTEREHIIDTIQEAIQDELHISFESFQEYFNEG